MVTKTENYFSTDLRIHDVKMAKALHKVGKLVARELNRRPSPQKKDAQRGKE